MLENVVISISLVINCTDYVCTMVTIIIIKEVQLGFLDVVVSDIVLGRYQYWGHI